METTKEEEKDEKLCEINKILSGYGLSEIYNVSDICLNFVDSREMGEKEKAADTIDKKLAKCGLGGDLGADAREGFNSITLYQKTGTGRDLLIKYKKSYIENGNGKLRKFY